jgi:hypothetical protein
MSTAALDLSLRLDEVRDAAAAAAGGDARPRAPALSASRHCYQGYR